MLPRSEGQFQAQASHWQPSIVQSGTVLGMSSANTYVQLKPTFSPNKQLSEAMMEAEITPSRLVSFFEA